MKNENLTYKMNIFFSCIHNLIRKMIYKNLYDRVRKLCKDTIMDIYIDNETVIPISYNNIIHITCC